MHMYTYYEIWANLTNTWASPPAWERELLFGSYDRGDCVAEIAAEREGWTEEGYIKIRIQSRETEEAPDPATYGAENCKRWAH